MNKFLTLTEAQRRTVFEQTAIRIKLPVASIEKDFWVTEILNILFSLPYADKMVFKGRTSLSKIWGVIRRFSEDIDIAIDRSMFGIEGDVTKKQLKKLRKASSIFVRDTFANDLIATTEQTGLSDFVTIKADPDGEGDATYPEPRQIHIIYKSVLPSGTNPDLRDEVLLEVGARSLFEPTAKAKIESFVTAAYPHLTSNDKEIQVVTAVAEKTFLEKAFLLHELFTTEGCRNANRKSRHLYDLYKMLEAGIADMAIPNNELWETIRHHREVFTSIRDVDYTPDVRKRIALTPPESVIEDWRNDYDTMVANMIYEDKVPTFSDILAGATKIESKFKTL
ncbi:nucleotidyl transferase AbiEii/AbiGii toxin family protein [Bacteroides caecimuris]|uniref:nucleotidyl transferase AbiEii/AbiGii toxin family protein n=4 Tax=Bacteroidales TaxID=171549 RepID=UPI00263B2513|nr:nucleotidyl transferase AbiEii/AbiGii toxin family protein [Bacteroides caecimuris]